MAEKVLRLCMSRVRVEVCGCRVVGGFGRVQRDVVGRVVPCAFASRKIGERKLNDEGMLFTGMTPTR